MAALNATNFNNITIQIFGKVLASKNYTLWPTNGHTHKNKHNPFWMFNECNGLKIEGNGTIDGQGYMWWVRELFNKNIAHRPVLININSSNNIEISGVFITNSPSFHIVPSDCANVYMHDFEIYVDIKGQIDLSQLFKFKHSNLL